MEEDMKVLEEMLNKERIWKTNRRGIKEIKFEVNSNYYKTIKNILKAYKEDEAVIEEMANEIFIEHNPHFKTTEEVIEYFRNKLKENKK